MQVGDKVFVCLRIRKNDALGWDLVTVERITQRYFYVSDFPGLRGKRISLEKMMSLDRFYHLFVPNQEQLELHREKNLRFDLINRLVKFNWGNLSTTDLQYTIDSLESKAKK